MVELISIGANFVKILDDESNVYLTFKCKENVILNDRVVEEAKRLIKTFVEDSEIESLYLLYELGWYLESVENV